MRYAGAVPRQHAGHNRTGDALDMEYLYIEGHEAEENGDLKDVPSHARMVAEKQETR